MGVGFGNSWRCSDLWPHTFYYIATVIIRFNLAFKDVWCSAVLEGVDNFCKLPCSLLLPRKTVSTQRNSDPFFKLKQILTRNYSKPLHWQASEYECSFIKFSNPLKTVRLITPPLFMLVHFSISIIIETIYIVTLLYI